MVVLRRLYNQEGNFDIDLNNVESTINFHSGLLNSVQL